jgi:hypothetical protein
VYDASVWIRIAIAVAVLQACGSSQFQSYQPDEIEQTSKSETFALALDAMRSNDLRILEQDEGKGLLSTQWQQFGAEHYNLQVLISPVSAVVNIGCRIEKAMTIRDCGEINRYPGSLVREAKQLSSALQ